MNDEKTPWFLNPTTMKILTWASWIGHVFSLVALYAFLPLWVGIVACVAYIFAERYVGFFLDAFGFVVSIIYSAVWLIIIIGIFLVYPWVLNYYVKKSIAKIVESVEAEDE